MSDPDMESVDVSKRLEESPCDFEDLSLVKEIESSHAVSSPETVRLDTVGLKESLVQSSLPSESVALDCGDKPIEESSSKNGQSESEERVLKESSSRVVSSGSGETVCQNGLAVSSQQVNGSLPASGEAPRTEMDAVLREESERLDIVMSPSPKKVAVNDNLQVVDKNVQYKRLIELLTKSQFYTEFLVKKLKQDELKIGSPRKGRRKVKNDVPRMDTPGCESHKTCQSDSQRVMEIAADVISNKKSGAAAVIEDVSADEDPDIGQTKTLINGLVVPLNQPKLLTGASLRDYQMEGLKWLQLLFENGVNGILADEMGLGKTIQVIALICHLIEKNVRGPFLIIGPLSTLPNWAIEFERFAPQIPFIIYHGVEEKRIDARKKMGQKKVVEGHKLYPVIITSYEYPLRDLKYLKKMQWRYIIIDEGHRIKNHNSLLSRALRQYKSANRLLLTGTPLHNSLSELWALLNFLVPEIFDDLEIFESWFRVEDLACESASEKFLEEEKKTHVLSTMHKILSPFMLRRVKSQVMLNLPLKKELVVYAPMTPIQLDLYRAVLDYNFAKLRNKENEEQVIENEDGSRSKRSCTLTKKVYDLEKIFALDDALSDTPDPAECIDNKMLIVRDKDNADYAIRVKMQNPAMMLRKIVNHPYLIQYPLEPGTEYGRIDEDIVKVSGKLQVLDVMLTKLKERGHKVLLFSTFTSAIDILEDYLSLRSFNYVRLDGSTKLDDRQIFIKKFNNDPDMFLFLISTRAGGLGINLASADTVIIFDSDWNPQVDLQAQDRCHRIGQTRPVVVYRFVTAGTVDERIVVRAGAKRRLEKIIIRNGNYSAIQKPQQDHAIDLNELRKLLTSRDHQRVIHPNGYVFSDEELEQMLDRSDLIEGKSSDTIWDGKNVEERSFKEYYGYTGTRKEIITEEMNNSVEIVDQDSNDAPCAVSPVRRNPLKKNCLIGTTLPHEQVSAENEQCEELKPDSSSVVSDSKRKKTAEITDSQAAKKYKHTEDNVEVLPLSKNINDASDLTTTRRTRATRRK